MQQEKRYRYGTKRLLADIRYIVILAEVHFRLECFNECDVSVGHTWNIPDSVMSLTLIAAGSSVPDVITSLIVVRDGMNCTLLLVMRRQS